MSDITDKPVRTLDQLAADTKTRDHVKLGDLLVGTKVCIQTKGSTYCLEKHALGTWLIDCPTPTPCVPHGSTWGGSALWLDRVAVGMHFEFGMPLDIGTGIIVTPPVKTISVIYPDGTGYELGEDATLGGIIQ